MDPNEELMIAKHNAREQAYMTTAHVYRDTALGDCTNHGASSRFDMLYIYAEHLSTPAALLDIQQHNLNIEQCFQVHRIIVGGKPFFNIKPLDPRLSGKWKMFGGNFAYSCDSRYREVTGISYPIPVHDRIED